MKVLVIPDIHQTEYYKKFLKEYYDEADKVVFLGDYFDTHTPYEPDVVSTEKAIENFKEIMELVKSSNKVDALIGNHDEEYITDDYTNTYQYLYCKKIERVVREHIDLLKIAIEIDGWIFSHAGISNSFLLRFGMADKVSGKIIPKENTIQLLNAKLIKEGANFLKFSPFDISGYGDDPTSSPIWIRPNSLLEDAAYPNQVVGHTAVGNNNVFYENDIGVKVVFTDTDKKNTCLLFNTKTEYNFKKLN